MRNSTREVLQLAIKADLTRPLSRPILALQSCERNRLGDAATPPEKVLPKCGITKRSDSGKAHLTVGFFIVAGMYWVTPGAASMPGSVTRDTFS